MAKRFVELVVADLEVQEAREYHDKGTKAQKHPYVRLRHLRKGGGKSFPNYEIKDRYVMYRLLKSCDPSLAYDMMMQTLYHVSIEDRPPMQDILQGYIDHAETDRIGVWVEYANKKPREVEVWYSSDDSIILAVDNTDFTMSHYFNSTCSFIRANYLPDYTESSRTMTMQGKQYPVMQFTKKEEDISWITPDKKIYTAIEILSCNNKTYIKGKVSVFPVPSNSRHNLQFTPMKVFDGFAHTLNAAELGAYLSRLTRTLEYAATLNLNPILGEFSDSNRLMDWMENSRLEYENAHKTKSGIDGLVNSFYNSLTD
mgnify:CR=1 FL=1|tara:strand:- start:2737 stop:3675 length:939 start_codon:yes stop_codon:yes gene_type:complete